MQVFQKYLRQKEKLWQLKRHMLWQLISVKYKLKIIFYIKYIFFKNKIDDQKIFYSLFYLFRCVYTFIINKFFFFVKRFD